MLSKSIRKDIFALSVYSCVIGLLFLTGPLYMMQVYDRVLGSHSIPTLVGLTALVVLLYAAMGLLEWVRNTLFSLVSSKFEEDLSEKTLSAVLDSKIESAGSISLSSVLELQTIKKFLSSPAPSAMFDAPWSFLFLLVLYSLHWAYGLLATAGGMVLIIIAFVNRYTTIADLRQSEVLSRQSNILAQELTSQISTAQALGMRSDMSRYWQGKLDQADHTMRQSASKIAFFTANAKAFRMMLQSSILGLGAWLVIQEHTTAGTMIASSILMGRAIAPIEQITSQWRSISDAINAWKALKTTLLKFPPNNPKMTLPAIQGNISFNNVYAGPPQQTKLVLKDVSFSLDVGDCLAIIGHSASGKTTLAQVLAGTLLTRSGEVRIDGASRYSFDVDELGKQIGYLPQTIDLFDGSIRENISRFTPSAEPLDIVAAAKAAGCHNFILAMKDGYDTPIGIGGTHLSGGQKQRIALARALYGQPRIVILDEPNSNLDSEGEIQLLQSIAELVKAKVTVVLIVHRMSSLRHCNKIMVLENGMIKSFGPKLEILEKIGKTQRRHHEQKIPETSI